MSAAKYANLPDIDVEGPDVYETPDVAPAPPEADSDNERPRGGGAGATNDELDNGSLPPADASGRFFRYAERRARRQRVLYSYPDSDSSSRPDSPTKENLTLEQRIEKMKNDLADLEVEARKGDEPTELIRELSDMRGRLHGMGARRRLVNAVLQSEDRDSAAESHKPEIATVHASGGGSGAGGGVVDMDKRIAHLEQIVGSSGTSLDESSALPQPLLPHLTRISALLTLLSQPRHIDSISRRLKLLLTDLERYNASGGSSWTPGAPLPPALAELAPLLQRLAPHIATIPAVLARLRTLSTLHASAAGFGEAVSNLEEDQRRLRAGLADLDEAVTGLESSMRENSGTIKSNVEGLEDRIATLEGRVKELSV